MKLILEDGISTKHCPNNTSESIILALYNNKVDGIFLKVFKTLDNILVINNCDKILNKKICESSYDELLKYNLGNKVKKHYILTLKEVFEIYNNSNKKIIIKPFSDQLVKDINNLAENYNVNLFIETNKKNSTRCSSSRIGINLSFNNLSYIHYDYDFYMIDYKSLKDFLQIYKLKNQEEVMFYNIETLNDYKNLDEITKNYLGNISIITNNYNLYNYFYNE